MICLKLRKWLFSFSSVGPNPLASKNPMKLRRFSFPVRSVVPCACALFIQMTGVSSAAPIYWDTNGTTAGSSNSTTNNWNGNVWTTDSTGSTATGAYVAGSDVVFSAGTNATGATTVLVSGAQSANSITFEEGTITMSAGPVPSPALSIGAGGITMAAGLNGNVNIGGSLGVITLSASQTWTNSTTGTGTTRTMTVGSTAAGSSVVGAAGQNIVLTLAGASTGTTTISGIVADGAGGTLALTKQGSGILTLTRANTFTGGVSLEAGTLNVNAAAALGTGTLTVKGGTLGNGSAAALTIANAQIWDGNFAFGGAQNLTMGTGAITLTGNRTIALNGTLTGSAGPVISIGSVIGGAFGLTTTNSSATAKGITTILEFTAENTYTGSTNVNGGVVRFASETATPDNGVGSIIAGNNGALSVSGVHTTLAGWLGDARLATSSTGALALTADSAENFNPTGFNGLSLGAELGKTVNYSGTITPSTGGYFVGGGGGTIVFSGTNAFTGTSALTLGNGGSGTTILNGSNDYAGDTTVKAGTVLSVRNNGALGGTAGGTVVETGGNVTLQGGVVITGEALTINGTTSTASASNLISGLSNSGGNNEWAGNVSAVFGSGTNVRFTPDSGDLLVSGNVALSGSTGQSLVLTGTSTGTVSGVISGNTITTAIIKNGTSTWTLSGDNTFTGAVRIDGGILKVSSIADNLGNGTSAIGFGEAGTSGTLVYTGAGETTSRGFNLRSTTGGNGTIDHSGTGTLLITGNVGAATSTSAKTLTLQGSTSGSGEISGVISSGSTSATSVIKTGTGTWRLSGVNTYTGTTSVTGGTLVASGKLNATTAVSVTNGTFAFGANDVVVDTATIGLGAGGILQMAGFDDALGALTVTGADAILNLAGGETIVTFANSSSTTWTGVLSITGWNGLGTGGGTEQVNFASAGLTGSQVGAVTFLNPEGFAAGIYSAKFVGSELVPDALIPEPSIALLGLSGGLLLIRRRR